MAEIRGNEMKTLLVSITDPIPHVMEDALLRTFRKICRDSSELDIECSRPALTRLPDLAYAYNRMLNSTHFCERVIKAQEQGYDAVITT